MLIVDTYKVLVTPSLFAGTILQGAFTEHQGAKGYRQMCRHIVYSSRINFLYCTFWCYSACIEFMIIQFAKKTMREQMQTAQAMEGAFLSPRASICM